MLENVRVGEAFTGMRALVLGASGFIGRWVARYLYDVGADLHLAVIDRSSAGSVFSRYGVTGEVHEADLADRETLDALLDHIRPSVTFNLAGYGVDKAERDEAVARRINTDFVEALCLAVAKFAASSQWSGQRLVHVGSAAEYGLVGGDLGEDTAPKPDTWYGRTKLAGTDRLRECAGKLGLPALTARLFTVYGPGEHVGRLLPTLLEAATSTNPVPLSSGSQKRDFTYVEDVAEGLLRLAVATPEPGTVVNLATGRLTSVREFILAAAEVLGLSQSQLRFGENPPGLFEMEHEEVTVQRLRGLTGWVPETTPGEGVRRTVSFLAGTG